MSEIELEESTALRCGRYIIALLASVLHKTEPPALPEGLTWEMVYDTARKHSVDAMVLSAVGPMVGAETELSAKWSRRRDEEMAQTLTQMGEEPRLLAAFSQAGLRAMPVKGSALRGLYPSPDMRQMSDIDLIVRPEEKAQAAALMASLGYRAEADFALSDEHEASFRLPPFLTVELHDSPVKPEDPRAGYYAGIWAKAQADAALPGVFHLQAEDEYLYLLVHFLQHYEDAGIGIRQVMDVYLFRRAHGKMDEEYLAREADAMGIRPMRQAIEALADHCFSGAADKAEPEIEEMEDYCILSGAYGSHRSRSIAIMRKAQDGQEQVRGWKLRYLWRRLFPPAEELCRRYPQAKKTPWLLPLYWLRRLLDVRYWKEHFCSEMAALHKNGH